MHSSDIPRIQARDTAHADDINRRITEWKQILCESFPYYSDAEILRLAVCYVADEETHPAAWETK